MICYFRFCVIRYFKFYTICSFKFYMMCYFKFYTIRYFRFYMICYFSFYMICYFWMYMMSYFKFYVICYFTFRDLKTATCRCVEEVQLAKGILNLGSWWRWVVRFRPWTLYPQGQGLWYTLNGRPRGPQNWSDVLETREISVLAGNRTGIPRCSVVTLGSTRLSEGELLLL
jgi:hypothetical protein